MFTWICPQCGSEVPPSYSECPTCAERQAAQQAKAGAPPPPHAAPTSTYAPAPPPQAQPQAYPQPQAQYPPPQQAYPPPQQGYAPPPPGYAPPPYGYQKPGPPAWLVTVGVAVALIAAFALLYKFVLAPKGSSGSAPSGIAFETPEGKNTVNTKGGAAAAGTSVHLAKVVEITGIRIFEEKRKPMVRFMVINHSQAPLDGITGTVTLRAQGKDDPIATIPVKVDSVAAFEGKDITAPLKTSMRAYELPDWQFIKIETQLESQ
ncbi:MAG: hypothetical protein IT168_14775 [Bryobacterales bacterium]|nr:hypothetical protein [Bryobacterales bacterium]